MGRLQMLHACVCMCVFVCVCVCVCVCEICGFVQCPREYEKVSVCANLVVIIVQISVIVQEGILWTFRMPSYFLLLLVICESGSYLTVQFSLAAPKVHLPVD